MKRKEKTVSRRALPVQRIPLEAKAVLAPKSKSILDTRIDRLNGATQRLGAITDNFHLLADRLCGMVGDEGKAKEDLPQPIDTVSRLTCAQDDLDATIAKLDTAYSRLQDL